MQYTVTGGVKTDILQTAGNGIFYDLATPTMRVQRTHIPRTCGEMSILIQVDNVQSGLILECFLFWHVQAQPIPSKNERTQDQ